ncbi:MULTISPECIES: TadG family pilus assembly protein [unclassified Variovorax]|uniref:TadG family pilus assembly protein n=1 Tax=unclassified Variovorax TaxID=663243 RepID=UPI003F482B89
MRPSNQRTARRQFGSVVINATIALSLLVIVLVGTELGYLFFMKRELQKTADLAAIAGAQSLGPADCGAAQQAAVINGNSNIPIGLDAVTTQEVVCGHWDSEKRDPPLHFGTPGIGQKLNAVHVTLTRRPALLLPSLPGNEQRPITVEALAAQQQPMASLTIRNTLVAVDDTKSPLLNAIFGGLLGGSLNVSALGWNGLLTSDIKLLDFLDQLKIALTISAGGYDQVLNTQADVGTLLQAMVVALQKSGQTAQATITALQQLQAAAQISAIKPMLKVADLLNIETGTTAAGLKGDLQLFQLVSGVVQLANGKNAAAIALDIPSLAGITASVKIKIVEPPQVSAVGNPNLIDPGAGITDPNKIYVRTSQIRTLISVNLSSLTNVISQITSAVTAALSPIISFLNSVATLNLGTIVTNLVGGIICAGNCPISQVIYTSVLPAPIDISVSSGNGAAYVTDHSCAEDNSKSLSVQATTSIAQLNIGKVSDTVFSSSDPVITAAPVPVVEIGYQEARYDVCILNILLGSIGCSSPKWKDASGTFVAGQANGAKHVISGLGLQINSSVGGTSTSTPLIYRAPAPENLPEIDAPPFDGAVDPSYKAITSQSIVGSLGATLGGIQLQPYASNNSGVLGTLLSGTFSLISGLLNTLQTVIKNALSPLLDPALNSLLNLLGIDLSKTEVSARLSCSRGAVLVY